MINALSNDIRYSNEPVARLESFLSWCTFPFVRPAPTFNEINCAKLIVEQSFSDYGDPDLLILLDYVDATTRAVLAEAKVSTDTGAPRTIYDQWDDFLTFLDGDRSKSSSLFVQLYRKVRLIQQAHNLEQGFPPDMFARRWSLGNNRVVRNAATLLTGYRVDPWFLAIVPDPTEAVSAFFNDHLQHFDPEPYNLPQWDVTRWGFLSWPYLHQQVLGQPNNWPQVIRNLAWNQHQIYPIEPQPDAVPAQGFLLYQNQTVYVAVPSTTNCRIVPANQAGPRFPKSFLVPTLNLVAQGQPAAAGNRNDLRPLVGNAYQWTPPPAEDPRPPRRGSVPVPPQRVMILARGWETSQVRQVDAGNQPFGNSFHVFNHHLVRAENE